MFFSNKFLNRIILSFALLVSLSFSSKQNSNSYDRATFIADFKEASLLVRLQDKSLSIKTLEERGLLKEAEQMRQVQYQENREILLSFKQTFDFCPVLFFYSSSSDSIRKGHYEGLLFNSEQERVSLQTSKVFIAEFSETEELGIDGLIVKDHQMLPLPEHLPYFERRYVLLGLIERSKARMVEAYNHKLQEYWRMQSKN